MDLSAKPRIRAWILFGVLVLLAAVGLWLRRPVVSPSGSAFRFLPPQFTLASEVRLESLRNSPLARQLAESLAHQGPVPPDREYEDFVRQTGFDYQRDLDVVSLVFSGSSKEPRLQIVAEGRFDRSRLVPNLESHAAARGSYRGRAVYQFQGQSGPYRLAFLDPRRLVISTGPKESSLGGVLDLADAGGESAAQRLEAWGIPRRIPEGSEMWLAADLSTLLSQDAKVQLGPYTADFLRGSRLLFVSGKFTADKWELNAEDECVSEPDAQRIAAGVRGLAGLLRALAEKPSSPSAPPRALSRILESLTVSVEGNRLKVKWSADAASLGLLLREATSAPGWPASAPGRSK